MTRRELVWCAAYGAAYAAELRRLGHGEETGRWTQQPDGARYDREVTDARDAAHAWATLCADAAAERVTP